MEAQVKALEKQLAALQAIENKEDKGDKGKKKWEKAYRDLQRVNGQLKDIATNVGGATGELLSFATDLSSSILTMLIGIEKLSEKGIEKISSTASAADKAIAQIERASVILTIIGAALQIFDSISKGIKSTFGNEENKKYIEDLIKTQDAYNHALIETSMLHKDVWGENKIKNTLSDVLALGKAMDDYNSKLYEQQEKWEDPNHNGIWRTLTALWTLGQSENPLFKGINDTNNGLTALRDNLKYITQHGSSGLLGSGIGSKGTKTTDLEKWIKDNLKTDLFDKDNRLNLDAAKTVLSTQADNLTTQTKEALESLIEYEEEVRKGEEALRGYISDTFGVLGDDATDAIVQAFRNGEDAAKLFKDNVVGILEDIGQQMVKSMLVDKVFDKYQEELDGIFTDYANDKNDTDFERKLMEATDTMFSNYESAIEDGNKILEAMQQAGKARNFDLYKPDEKEDDDSRREASKKGIESMSQDSATELIGGFTAQRLLLSDIKGEISLQTGIQSDMSTTLMEIRNYSSEVVGNMQTMKETSILIVEHLGAIGTNTARLEAIENGIKDINIFGLKLRNV
ncbi:hypothetical protein EZS27_019869 [termite gut metagenome]|uniref:Uncharacterized protein n=1 Tax=termite gut metagenome TaxID=433724 RepID=A0A5J4RF75_9ZZZZ